MRVLSHCRAPIAPFLTVVLLAAGVVTGVGAQAETVTCELAPLTLPLFDATPAAQVAATPAPTRPGAAPDDATIREAIDIIVACINTGDAAYQYAIFTDHYLAGRFADPTETYQPQFEYELSMGPAEVVPMFELVEVTDVTELADGRVAVTVEVTSGGATYRDIFTLVNVDGAWLIDAVEELEPTR